MCEELLNVLDDNIETVGDKACEEYKKYFPSAEPFLGNRFTCALILKNCARKEYLSSEHVPWLEKIFIKREQAEEFLALASSSGEDNDKDAMDFLVFELVGARLMELSIYKYVIEQYINSQSPDNELQFSTLAPHPGLEEALHLLGVEKALLRSLETMKSTLKYGLFYDSSFIHEKDYEKKKHHKKSKKDEDESDDEDNSDESDDGNTSCELDDNNKSEEEYFECLLCFARNDRYSDSIDCFCSVRPIFEDGIEDEVQKELEVYKFNELATGVIDLIKELAQRIKMDVIVKRTRKLKSDDGSEETAQTPAKREKKGI